MDKVHTFRSCCGSYEFTVKRSFIRFCPRPEEQDVYILMSQYDMAKYLHNDKGPAIRFFALPYKEEYWVNGEKLAKEDAQKRSHDIHFNEKIRGLLDD